MSYRGRNPPFRRPDSGTSIRNNTSGSRLRPVSDPLDAVGFPSKGDKTYVLSCGSFPCAIEAGADRQANVFASGY